MWALCPAPTREATEQRLLVDAGTGETGHGLGGLVQGADDAGAALAGAGELDGGADLGLHGTLAELALVGQTLGLVGGEVLELLLVGLAEVDGDVLDGGQQEQDVASQSSASSSPPRSLSMTAGTPL